MNSVLFSLPVQEGIATVRRSLKARGRGPIFSSSGQLASRGQGRLSKPLPSYVDLIIERKTTQPVDVIIDRSSQNPFVSHIRASFTGEFFFVLYYSY